MQKATATTTTIAETRTIVAAFRHAGERIAFVPTMGALHEGHLSLVRLARENADRVVVSIFVNPKQFGATEDLSRYPRDPKRDRALLEREGVDLLFAPTVQAIYPAGFATGIDVGPIARPLEGAHRPGHFAGVATILAKLFAITTPDVAIFGQKDWQQLLVVRRLVADLNLPVRIIAAPIWRAADGLAMSSRNRYLTAAERPRAALLPATLAAAARAIADGAAVQPALAQAVETLAAQGVVVEYLVLADEETLVELHENSKGARLFVAACVGATRLIDNLAIGDAADAAAAFGNTPGSAP